MALHPNFPTSPYVPLIPEQRWFPADEALDPAKFGNQLLALKPFTPEETREIVFKTMLDAEVHHTIQLDGTGPADYRSVVAFFARQLLKDLRLVGGYELLYPKVRGFMRENLLTPSPVNLEDPVVLRNLSEPDAGKILYDSFKAANDNFSTSEIGKYFSALSNEANLRGRSAAWLVFGLDNSTRRVIGTDYRREKERLQSLKHQIAQGTDPSTSFREIHELNTPPGRVVLFEIPAAPRGLPIAWQTHFYARDGSTLTGLSISKQDEIRAQGLADDWSAIVCKNATIADLDPEALTKARDIFVAKFRERIPEQTIRSWDDTTFLDQAKLTARGGITRACLLLLGREQTTTLLNPYVAELSWKLEGPERGYEHFHPPFLLNTSRLFRRIRNLRLSLLPPGQLIPVDIPKYDERIVLEALHNCIAHQDYARCERVLVIERLGELEFQNAGEFFDGTPDDYIRGNRSPRRYRNRFLAEAMVTLRMIDTMGFGIREVMWKGQAGRYLPLPDFDLSEPGHVKLRLQGRFMDENYSRALLTHADLPWPDVLALDTVQKGGLPDDDLVQDLRHRGLVEGRKPKLHVAADVAAATDTEAEYLHHRAFDDAYFCDLILEYLKKFGSGKRPKFNRLLEGKLSDLLSPAQKRYKINHLLKRLQREGKIKVDGYGKAGVWKLAGQ